MRKSNEWKKSVSVVMAALLMCSGIQIPAQAKETDSLLLGNGLAMAEKMEPEVKTAEVELSDQDRGQLAKEETVYVIANADGSTQKLIVSDWLKNAMGSQTLEDATELTNITNVKGTENFQPKDGNLGVWDAAGNDIYYQGNIEKELPIDLKISYQLNGRSISPDELAGQSGKVSIRFDYTNRQKETVAVGEGEEDLYVPFVIMTGLVLDNENFRNIEVTNGKVINDGERTIVMGYAMPGLKDNLDIGSEEFDIEELDIPEYVELTADVTDFELAATMTVATNEIFGDMDIDTQEKMDELTADMDDLEEAMGELMDGTSDLYDGVLELRDGTDELYDGMEELNDGARKLRDGASSLKSGAGELVKGINTLADGLAELTKNNDTIMTGAAQVYNMLLGSANEQLQAYAPQLGQLGLTIPKLTIENCATVLPGVIHALDAALEPYQGLLGTMSLSAEAAVLSLEETAVEQKASIQQTEQPEEKAENSADQEEEVKQEEEIKQEEPKQEEPKEEQEIKQPEESEAAEQVQEEEEQKEEQEQGAENTEAVVQEKEVVLVQTAPSGPTPEQIEMIKKLKSARDSLAGLLKYDEFYKGLQAYTGGVAQAYQGAQALLEGAKKLSSGAAELKDGTIELKDGTHDLKDGGQELKDGVEELRDGSKELKDGTVEFNDEGIQKLVNLFEDDVQGLSDRMDAVKLAAQSYKSFSGITDGTEGSVRFVYKTAGIEK